MNLFKNKEIYETSANGLKAQVPNEIFITITTTEMDNVEVNYVDNYEFEYDAFGRRLIYTDANGNKTLYYYDGIRVILEKTKVGAQWVTSKVYTLQDGAIGFIISEYDSESEKSRWSHYDRLGNVMDIIGENDGIIASYDQDAFGNVLSGSASGYHLTTKRNYVDIGLYYFFARWYDPETARFLTRTIMSRFIEHPYNYAENNPIRYKDPLGLNACPEGGDPAQNCKCWEAANRRGENGEFSTACIRKCATACASAPPTNPLPLGFAMGECLRNCTKGAECADAFLGMWKCYWCTMGDPKKLRDCIDDFAEIYKRCRDW